MRPRIEWDLVSAVGFCRVLKPLVEFNGWGLSLGGSMLANGYSTKDIDLVFFPMNSRSAKARDLYAVLHRFASRTMTAEEVREKWRVDHGSNDLKHVEVWTTNSACTKLDADRGISPEWCDRRIDVFILGATSGLHSPATVAGE